MIVELGIVGIIITIGLCFVIASAIQRLRFSKDPMDVGLRITAVYCLVAILVSQFFDFGLIAPANLIVVMFLFPTIIARAALVPTKRVRKKKKGSRESESKFELLKTRAQEFLLSLIHI